MELNQVIPQSFRILLPHTCLLLNFFLIFPVIMDSTIGEFFQCFKEICPMTKPSPTLSLTLTLIQTQKFNPNFNLHSSPKCNPNNSLALTLTQLHAILQLVGWIDQGEYKA